MKISKIRYYEPINWQVGAKNDGMVPFLMGSAWLGQHVKKELQLNVFFPKWTGENATSFDGDYTRFMVNGCVVEEGKNLSYRGARLWMSGEVDGQEVFALADLIIDRPDLSWTVVFSPVPFGADCKPKLPNTPGLKESIAFLLRFTSAPWVMESLNRNLQEAFGKVKGVNIGRILFELQQIGVGEQDGNTFRVIMTHDRFKKIFGLSLFETPKLSETEWKD